MRKNWITALAAAGLTVGGAGMCNAWPNIGMGSPQNGPAPGQFAPGPAGAPGSYGQPPAQPTWTQKVMAPFKSTPTTIAHNQPNPAEVARRQSMDPISLGYTVSPGSPQLYVAMAEMSHRGGNVEQARQLYQKALAMDPKHADALLSAARMEDREGQMDVALGLYQRAAAAQPQNPTALNDLALCLARKGDIPSAYRALKDTINLDSRKPLYRNNMAKVLIEMNRVDEAAWNLAAVHPPAVVEYNMGVLMAQRGRNVESAQFLSRAIAIDPSMQPARVLLSQLAPANQVAVNVVQQPVIRTAQAPAPAVTMTPAPTAQPAAVIAPTLPVIAPATPATASATPDNSILPTPATPAEAATPQATAAPQQPAATSAPAATPAAPVNVNAAATPSPTPLAVLPSRLPAVY